ncbi:MAG: preprotein translocase subunit SecG [Lentisphaerae bacterium GWF2_38_69]|nr:MAG: preprotein translocase subunit SecG [Lentisphaerae bacterium GWF2_38_69]
MTTLLTIFDVLIAILIIALVLVQQSKKGGGLGTTFGGGGSDSLFGAHASSHLSKLTVVFSAIFLVVTLALAIISGRGLNRNESSLDNMLEKSTISAPAQHVQAPVTAAVAATDTATKK